MSAAPSAAATLKVSSFPSGAQVSIDGINTGKVTPMNITVVEGDHSVTVAIPGSGWQSDTRTVTIVSGNNDLSVTLLPTATHAAGPCFDNTNRYVNCLNGTVTDTVTGLIWLQQADCLPNAQWDAANQAAAGLKDGDCGLTDGSSPGDWRLPTKDEWSATMAHAVALGCTGVASPPLTNDAGTACFGNGSASSFTGVATAAGTAYRWTRSTYEPDPTTAWLANFVNGGVDTSGISLNGKFISVRVWPVRGGPR
jgi:hypothetical protein